jgi:hypothetical protein
VSESRVSPDSDALGSAAEAAEPAQAPLELTLPGGLSRALDAWIANQIEPKPTRETAILQILREALGPRFGS